MRRNKTKDLSEAQRARRIKNIDRELFHDAGVASLLKVIEGGDIKNIHSKLLSLRDFILVKQNESLKFSFLDKDNDLNDIQDVGRSIQERNDEFGSGC